MKKETYLMGDGVYAEFDGYQIWLHTLEGNRIALERETMEALSAFARTVHPLVGQPVIYTSAHGTRERGVITSVGKDMVFVCYNGETSTATFPANLTFFDGSPVVLEKS